MRTSVWIAFPILLAAGCRNSAEPASDLSGQWAVTYSFPGSSFEFTLTQVNDSLHGTGSFAMEAGSAGTLDVRGAYARPAVALVFAYESGRHEYFTGQVERSRMVGTATDSAGHTYPRTFNKR